MATRNTGYKGWTTLEQYDPATGIATGLTKPNTQGDPDYVAPVQDVKMCPTNTLAVSPTSQNVLSFGDAATITVDSNSNWQVASNVSWAQPDRSSGSGNVVMEIHILASSSDFTRTATITFTSGTITRTASITQDSRSQNKFDAAL